MMNSLKQQAHKENDMSGIFKFTVKCVSVEKRINAHSVTEYNTALKEVESIADTDSITYTDNTAKPMSEFFGNSL